MQPLAVDEYGRIGSWVKSFHPRPGSGWVQLSPACFGVPMTAADLALMERIANYGLE